VCERTIPIEYLDDKGKGKPREMKDPYRSISYSPNGTEEKKQDPEEVNQDNDICKNFVDHLLSQISGEMIL
jgi:hypothetical protein